MRRALLMILTFALSACGGTTIGSHAVPGMPYSGTRPLGGGAGPTNWSVVVGGAADHYALQVLDYYPNSITIDAGDTVTYKVASGGGGDAHTVTFVPPKMKIPSPLSVKDENPHGGTIVDGKKYVNSGILFGGQTFTLSFPKPGTYRILCLFHAPAMESTVIVQRAGSPYPYDQSYYRKLGNSQQNDDLHEARDSVALFPFTPDGTTLAAGIDPGLVQYPPSDVTVLRYVDTNKPRKVAATGNLTIKVGTVVTFINETSNEPHTVTLNVAGQSGLPNIPPDPPVNATRHGINKYDGSKIVNSGTFIGGGEFRLMFTAPGTFYYGCIYHVNSGMAGTITVTE